MSGTISTTTFIETQFPTDISYGSTGGSGFSTGVFSTEGGYEQRNINWSRSKGEWDVSQAIKSVDQMQTLTEFFMAMRGRGYGFRFKDWNDYQIANQTIGAGDGATQTFQLIKTYQDPLGLVTFNRLIEKPVVGSLTSVLISGVPTTAFTLDYTTGLVTFTAAPASGAPIVVLYCEFDVPARFDTDKLEVKQEFWNTSSWNSIKIVELRE